MAIIQCLIVCSQRRNTKGGRNKVVVGYNSKKGNEVNGNNFEISPYRYENLPEYTFSEFKSKHADDTHFVEAVRKALKKASRGKTIRAHVKIWPTEDPESVHQVTMLTQGKPARKVFDDAH